MPLIEVTVPTGTWIKGRGRNGWFNVSEVSVNRPSTEESYASVSIYSKQRGEMPPILLDGSRAEITQLFQNILAALKGEEQ